MKNLSHTFSLSVCAAVALFAPSIVRATIIYQDDFSGTAGSLMQGRSPDVVNTTGDTYTSSSSSYQVNGSGLMVATPAAAGQVNLALPAISLGDVITLTASIRPAGTGWIALGFTQNSSSSLSGAGSAWALLNGEGSANAGKVAVWSGPGTTSGSRVYLSSSAESGYNGASPSTFTLSYNTGTGIIDVSLGGITVYNGSLSYNGVAGAAAPLSALQFAEIQFFGQNAGSSATPGYVDNFTVAVTAVPEPATYGLCVVGFLFALVLSKRRATHENAVYSSNPS